MTTLRACSHARLAVTATTVASLWSILVSGTASAAALKLVTPGEQNTASAEFQCTTTPCPAGKYPYYPEILQMRLGAAYTVVNAGDGGAVLGCDTATAAAAGNNSFCKSAKYTASITPPPDVVIIGPFGEHDQRIVAGSPSLYNEATFVAAYEALVADYLKYTTHVYMVTPIDLPWNATALPAGEDLVKSIMLPAAKTVAANHNLTVIDAYTAITGTPALVTQYYHLDGQLNAAGQQKLADLILAALASGSDAGVALDASATSGSASGSTGGGSGTSASGTIAASGGSGATSGATSTSGTSATSGNTTAGSGSSATSGAATSGDATGSGSAQGGSGSTGGGSGTLAASGGQGTAGNGSAGTTPAGMPSNTSGCAFSGRESSGASALLLALGLFGLARRRSARTA